MSKHHGSKGPSERAPLGKQRDAIRKEQQKRAALMKQFLRPEWGRA
jgi:hypothetical protein